MNYKDIKFHKVDKVEKNAVVYGSYALPASDSLYPSLTGYDIKNRFTIDADRTDGGYLRGWFVNDKVRKCCYYACNRNNARAWIADKLSSELTPAHKRFIGAQIKILLHESRANLRSLGTFDTTKVQFHVADPYYCEAFGMLRTVQIMGLGGFGSCLDPNTLSGWFENLKSAVLAEENFGGSGQCECCFNRYAYDDARPQSRP